MVDNELLYVWLLSVKMIYYVILLYCVYKNFTVKCSLYSAVYNYGLNDILMTLYNKSERVLTCGKRFCGFEWWGSVPRSILPCPFLCHCVFPWNYRCAYEIMKHNILQFIHPSGHFKNDLVFTLLKFIQEFYFLPEISKEYTSYNFYYLSLLNKD